MGKADTGSGQHKKLVVFYLDECLPYQIANILKSVGYPITSWWEEFHQQQGLKDPYLIPYLGGKAYTWITKDDEAKKEHEEAIRIAQISVIWISGLDRITKKQKRNLISIKDLHRMLTEKLGDVEDMIACTNKPQYLLLGMRTDGHPVLNKTTLEVFFNELPD